MRSRAEHLLRAVAALALGWAIWCGLRGVATTARPATRIGDDPTALTLALHRWTVTDPAASIDLRLASPPSAPTRAWLAAIAALGTVVTWGPAAGDTLPATAIDVEPIADPRRGVRVGVAAPAGRTVVLRDVLGPLDSARATRRHGGVGFRVGGPLVAPEAVVGGTGREATRARGTAGDSLVLRSVLVIGRAGWEGKFVVRALASIGWKVDARLVVAPHADVVIGLPAPIDTAHYAAVVLLDSGGATSDAVRRYAQSGGGLIVRPAAQHDAGLPVVGTGPAQPAAPTLADSAPRRGLALTPLDTTDAALVVLERRDRFAAVVARRAGAGREAVEGYDDTWRVRMAAGDDGPRAHAEWWGRLVSAVAYAPVIVRATDDRADRAPLAATVATLGPPTPPGPVSASGGGPALPWWLYGAIMIALGSEWGSRRLRGAA